MRILVLLAATAAVAVGQTSGQTLGMMGKLGEVPNGWSASVQSPAGLPLEVPAGTGTAFAKLVDQGCRTSARCVMLTGSARSQLSGNPMRILPAEAYRMRQIRLGGEIRVHGAGTLAKVWLRLERADGTTTFLEDNATWVSSPEWTPRQIEAGVTPDVARIAFGFVLWGTGTAWVDGVALETISTLQDERPEPPAPLAGRALANLVAFAKLYGYVRYFHPSDQAAATEWESFVLEGVRKVQAAASDRELAARLSVIFAPIAPAVQIYAEGRTPPDLLLKTGPRIVRYEHHGIFEGARKESVPGPEKPDIFHAQLAPGVLARVPLVLYADKAGTLPHAPIPAPRFYYVTAKNRSARLAAVMIAWNLFQHFYPYFDVVSVDWPAALKAALTAAATDGSGLEFLSTLRRMVAALHDGHGRVLWNGSRLVPSPVGWDWVEGRLVITDVPAPNSQKIERGDIVVAINGKPTRTAMSEAEAEISAATPQWLLARALGTALHYGKQPLGAIGEGLETEPLILELQPVRHSGAGRTVALDRRISRPPVRETKPDPIAELKSGILYVDLTRISDNDWRAGLPRMATARGLIFDMRGYPGRLSSAFLTHLSEKPMMTPQMVMPEIALPDHTDMNFKRSEGALPARLPYLTAKKVFLTDGSAISYAETIMSIVERYKLGEIVGSPTAGTNGNTYTFRVPCGYSITFTGMKVLKQGGSQHHGVGIPPTVPASRTLAGVAAGKDQVLERALEQLK